MSSHETSQKNPEAKIEKLKIMYKKFCSFQKFIRKATTMMASITHKSSLVLSISFSVLITFIPSLSTGGLINSDPLPKWIQATRIPSIH